MLSPSGESLSFFAAMIIPVSYLMAPLKPFHMLNMYPIPKFASSPASALYSPPNDIKIPLNVLWGQ